MEEWKFLYDSKIYQVSNTGKIRSIERTTPITRNGMQYTAHHKQKEIAQRHGKNEPYYYCSIQVHDENLNYKRKTIYLHKAVADHFVEKPEHIINEEACGYAVYASHIEKDYTNNNHTNIKWITHAELIQSQPKRLADPKKFWRTRVAIYGSSGGNKRPVKNDE